MFIYRPKLLKLISIILLIVLHGQSLGVFAGEALSPSPAYAATMVCGQDLNNDGVVGPDEFSLCQQSAGDWLCPVGAVNCTAAYSAPICPSGGSYNNVTKRCEAAVNYSYTCSTTGRTYPDQTTCNNNCAQTASCAQGSINISGVIDSPYYWNDFNNIMGNGNSISGALSWCYQGEYGQICEYLPTEGQLSLTGMTVSGNVSWISTIGTGWYGTEIRGNGDRIDFYSIHFYNSSYVGSLIVSGATVSGEIVSRYAIGMAVGNGNRIDFYNPRGWWGVYQGSLTFTSTASTCPLSGGSACSGSPPTCSAPASCTTNTSCPSGYTQSGNICIADPSCRIGTFDPVENKCYEGQNNCPLGSQHKCLVNTAGVSQCSPNPCVNKDNPANVETAPIDDSMLQNDGPRDAEGNCLGSMYIFSGRAMRCNLSGYDNSWKNCCDVRQGAAATDSMGSITDVVQTVQRIRTIYQMGQVAYYANVVAQGGSIAVNAAGAHVVTTAAGASTTLSSSVGSAVLASKGAAAPVSTALNSYVSSLLNPTTIAIAAAIYIAISLLSKGCNQQDIETSMLNRSKMCRFIGTFCKKRIKFIGCIQRSNAYCCFNSKLARIIHEQGRPQLKAFPGGGWGTMRAPNCRGLTPEEFQAIDFSQIDLAEYFEDIKTRAEAAVQQNVGEKVQKFYDNIKK